VPCWHLRSYYQSNFKYKGYQYGRFAGSKRMAEILSRDIIFKETSMNQIIYHIRRQTGSRRQASVKEKTSAMLVTILPFFLGMSLTLRQQIINKNAILDL